MHGLLDRLMPISDAFEPSTLDEINHLNSLVGVVLPADYLAFLGRFGRCMIDGEASIDGKEVFSFFGTKGDAGNIVSDYLAHDDYIASRFVPIADDLFNNRYLLNALTGEIGFVDYSHGASSYSSLAPSFADFVSRISVAPLSDGA